MAVAAFPAFHVTGAIHHYVAWPAIAATPVYLGTCESSPQVAFQSFFGDWATDNSGPHLPEQRSEGGETASLAQTLPVPVATPYLAYWQWVDSTEAGCYYDVVTLWVNDNVVEAYGLCAGLETNSWTRRAVDLSAYAGQTVALRIQVTTDGSAHSSLFLDDVAFESGP